MNFASPKRCGTSPQPATEVEGNFIERDQIMNDEVQSALPITELLIRTSVRAAFRPDIELNYINTAPRLPKKVDGPSQETIKTKNNVTAGNNTTPDKNKTTSESMVSLGNI